MALKDHRNFLVRASTRDFTMMDIVRMSEDECFWRFVQIRFGSQTEQTCPHCGTLNKHYFRRKQRRWTCKDCFNTFSCTSGTIFHSRKLPFKTLLIAIAMYISGANGRSMLHLHRDLDIQAKSAFVLMHKFREAIQIVHEVPLMSGVIELDGGHFGGRPRSGRVRRRPSRVAIAEKVNTLMTAQNAGKKPPRTRPTRANIDRLKNRRIVFTIRQHSGQKGFGARHTFVTILSAESAEQVRASILKMVAPGSTIMTDENSAYSWLESAGYRHEVVNHQHEFSTPDGVNENQAECYFSRLRRFVLGVSLRIGPKYMKDYAVEMAWREDLRRETEGQKNQKLLCGLLKPHYSKWRGYFQSRAAVNFVK